MSYSILNGDLFEEGEVDRSKGYEVHSTRAFVKAGRYIDLYVIRVQGNSTVKVESIKTALERVVCREVRHLIGSKKSKYLKGIWLLGAIES